MNMEEQLRSVVDKATVDGELWHKVIHGNNTTEVQTENGKVPTVAKQLKDVRDSIVGGVINVVSRAEAARDIALQAQSQTESLKSDTQTICNTAKGFRNEAEGFKNQSQSTFNNIVPVVNAAILSVETAGDGQVARVQNEVLAQIELAKEEADRAELATDGKLDINCANIDLVAMLTNLGLTAYSLCNVFQIPLLFSDNVIRHIIIQFGTVVVNKDSELAFNFNKPFPNAVLTTQATFCSGINLSSDAGCSVYSVSKIGAVAQNGGNWQAWINWFAIGY